MLLDMGPAFGRITCCRNTVRMGIPERNTRIAFYVYKLKSCKLYPGNIEAF
jgi:hypothetical protein